MERIEFTRNYSDLSTNEGFQFEFFCDRCGSGYRTPFQASVIGRVSGALDTASGLFGGILGKAAYLGERARSAGWEQAHDKAFAEAAEELKPTFARCPRCSSWVCRDSCWNEKRGLCKNRAPDLGVEMSAPRPAIRSRKSGRTRGWPKRTRSCRGPLERDDPRLLPELRCAAGDQCQFCPEAARA